MLSMILTVTAMLTTSTVVSESIGARPAPDDACSLLTKEDAAAALGEPVTGPKSKAVPPHQGMTASSCEYEGSGLHKIHLNLMHFTAATASVYRAMCAEKNKDGLAGLGDIACWYNDKHEELQLLKGTTFVSIQIQTKGNPTEAIKAAMKKAAARL